MKYHIPKEEELFDGYEFELQVYDYKNYEYIDEWEKNVFDVRSGLEHDEYHTFTEGRVRVEKFSLEQLIPLGYTIHTNNKGTYSWAQREDCIIDIYDEETISIILHDPTPGSITADLDLFCGGIPTLNDFKKLKQYIDRIQ